MFRAYHMLRRTVEEVLKRVRQSSKQLFPSFFRFVIVGVASLVVDVVVVAMFLALGFIYPLAVTSGYLASWVLNFVGHKLFTFRQRHWRAGEIARYLVAAGSNYAVTMLWVAVAVEVAGLKPFLAKLSSLPFVTLIGFFLARLWVFRAEEPSLFSKFLAMLECISRQGGGACRLWPKKPKS